MHTYVLLSHCAHWKGTSSCFGIAHRFASLCIRFAGISILIVAAATLTPFAVAILVIHNYLDSGCHLILIYTYILSCYRLVWYRLQAFRLLGLHWYSKFGHGAKLDVWLNIYIIVTSFFIARDLNLLEFGFCVTANFNATFLDSLYRRELNPT